MKLFVALLTASFAAASEQLQIGIVSKAPSCEIKASAGDYVSVHYAGRLKNGEEFDSSYSRGDPIQFALGAHQVIEGWENGILGMCLGEKRRLIIPPSLGYGDEGVGKIPGGSTLVFDTELVGVNGVNFEPESKSKTKEDL